MAAVVAVYVAAAISTIQEELTGVHPEELASEIYSRLVYGESREAADLEQALKTLKEPRQAPHWPGDLWDKHVPPEDHFDRNKLLQELTLAERGG